MNFDLALEFLKNHQPLPNDREISQEIIAKYDEVRKWFLANPNETCIPLFLNSFGGRDGFGVYPLICNVVVCYKKEVVIPHLLKCLSSENKYIQYWNCQIAVNFSSPSLIKPLSKLLNSDDSDIRFMSITALYHIGGDEVKQLLQDRLKVEEEEDVKEVLIESIEDMG